MFNVFLKIRNLDHGKNLKFFLIYSIHSSFSPISSPGRGLLTLTEPYLTLNNQLSIYVKIQRNTYPIISFLVYWPILLINYSNCYDISNHQYFKFCQLCAVSSFGSRWFLSLICDKPILSWRRILMTSFHK